MSLKDMMTSYEYNGYIKGQILNHATNNDWQKIYELLREEKLIQEKNETEQLTAVLEVSKPPIKKVKKEKTQPIKTIENPVYNRVSKTERMFEKYIKNAVINHEKNGCFFEHKITKEVLIFEYDGKFFIPMSLFKNFFDIKKQVYNWDKVIGSYWRKATITKPSSIGGRLFPYKLLSPTHDFIEKAKKTELKFDRALTVFEIRDEFLKELDVYDYMKGVK